MDDTVGLLVDLTVGLFVDFGPLVDLIVDDRTRFDCKLSTWKRFLLIRLLVVGAFVDETVGLLVDLIVGPFVDLGPLVDLIVDDRTRNSGAAAEA